MRDCSERQFPGDESTTQPGKMPGLASPTDAAQIAKSWFAKKST